MDVAWGSGGGLRAGVGATIDGGDVDGDVDWGIGVDDGRGDEWITPTYSMMKDPGLRSLVAKRPAWPQAGCAGSVICVIFTMGQGPFGRFGGIESASCGLIRRLARCSALKLGEYEGFLRYRR